MVYEDGEEKKGEYKYSNASSIMYLCQHHPHTQAARTRRRHSRRAAADAVAVVEAAAAVDAVAAEVKCQNLQKMHGEPSEKIDSFF